MNIEGKGKAPEAPAWKPPIRERFGKRLRPLRESRGYTQVQLAVLADIDRSYYSDIERGIKNSSLQIVEQLADALEMKLDELLKDI